MSSPSKSKKPAYKSPGITFLPKIIKGDTFLVMADPQYQLEDEFAGNYFTLANSTKLILQPPFDPKVLARLAMQNNILSQCIDVMEVNIDGTGYDFVPVDGDVPAKTNVKLKPPKPPLLPPPPIATAPPDDSGSTDSTSVTAVAPAVAAVQHDQNAAHAHTMAVQDAKDKHDQAMQDYKDEVARQAKAAAEDAESTKLRSFFDEPYPNLSFISLRRTLRRQIEEVGFGFLEVLRNPTDDIVGLRNVLSHATRFVKLDTPIQAKKVVQRDGKDVTLTMWVRERRFAQRLWGVNVDSFVYYREFGSTRQINRNNGEWESKDNPVAKEDRGTELLLFGLVPDTDSPYFVPRWINQLPSVVGGRKAEEANLEFFDAGGLPPAIIFVQGGTLAEDVSDQLKMYMSGMAKNRNRAAIVEAQSASGSLESAGQVKVTVERFGAEATKDSLFMNYSKQTSDNIRQAFRFTDLFLGDATHLNFAVALTAFMVAEAQVFAPERMDFDEIINRTIIKEMGIKLVKLKSNPITLKNVEVQLQAIGLVEQLVDQKALVDEVNKIAGTNLEFDQKAADAAAAAAAAPAFGAPPTPGGLGPDGKPVEGAPNDQAKNMPIGTKIPAPKTKVPPGLGLRGLTSGLTKSETPATTAREMFELVDSYMHMHGLAQRARAIAPSERRRVKMAIERFTREDSTMFYQLLASITLGNPATAELINHDETHH